MGTTTVAPGVPEMLPSVMRDVVFGSSSSFSCALPGACCAAATWHSKPASMTLDKHRLPKTFFMGILCRFQCRKGKQIPDKLQTDRGHARGVPRRLLPILLPSQSASFYIICRPHGRANIFRAGAGRNTAGRTILSPQPFPRQPIESCVIRNFWQLEKSRRREEVS